MCNSQTMDDIIEKLKGAKYFTVFDTSKGLFHVPLDQESKMLTPMVTPFGIFVYNMLAMGLSNATDMFQTCIREILEGLNMPAGKTIKNLDVSIHAIEEFTGFNSISVEKLCQHTASDPDLRLLIDHINNGFPDTSAKCPECMQPYFSFRDKLST